MSVARIRDSVTRAIALVQKSQKNWYSARDCTSCHQQVLPALAVRAARLHGVPVDDSIAHTDAVRAFGVYADFDRAVQWTHLIDPPSDGYALIGADAAGVRPNLTTAVYARLLAARQESDGRWEPVDQRPPQHYSPFTDTVVAARAIQLYRHVSQERDTAARLERARTWLVSHPAHCTEERVFQLLGAYWLGAERGVREEMAAGLKRTQQPDGGWNSLDGRASDAYSTGEALFVLHEAGAIDISDSSWQRGVDYLLRTQIKDGSWHVISRLNPPAQVSPPYFETGYPFGHDQYISVMGACWAVMALSAALGPAAPEAGLPALDAAPKGIEPWAESVMFGSIEELQRLLDGGFDPNSATKSGGTTALMLAAPDVSKMKLLIAHGANVNARAKSKYSALMVAAQYPGSAAAISLLLDHGAKPRLGKGEGAPLFNAFPLLLAAFSGNSESLARLRASGDRVDDKIIFLGMFPTTPLLSLASTHRTDSVRALLDIGADVDETDGDGTTILEWAAIANRVETARLLIERGADVNHVDKKGMTPLLYAASIDFGDSAMINLLLKSGANPGTRTREGLTALDLARKYNHTHLISALEVRP